MRPITALYIITFLYAVHYAVPLHSESFFLEKIVGVEYVGIVYGVAAFISLATTISISSLLRRISIVRFTLLSIVLEAASLLVLAFGTHPSVLIIAFILHIVFLGALFIALNIMVEAVSSDYETGRVRGVYLTILNTGILIGPLIASRFVENGFTILFSLSAFCILAASYYVLRYLSQIEKWKYSTPNVFYAIRQLRRNPDTAKIVYAQFLLELFYSVVVIFVPLFLLQSSAITLPVYLGIVLPIVLIPFVILPYPLGRLADTRFGEKEMLICGFGLMTIGLLLLAFIPQLTLPVVILILLLSRIGASMAEEMTSSYFYKHVSVSDADIISLFSNTRNAALIIGPLLGALLASIHGESLVLIFVVFAGMLTLGIIPLFKLHDTK